MSHGTRARVKMLLMHVVLRLSLRLRHSLFAAQNDLDMEKCHSKNLQAELRQAKRRQAMAEKEKQRLEHRLQERRNRTEQEALLLRRGACTLEQEALARGRAQGKKEAKQDLLCELSRKGWQPKGRGQPKPKPGPRPSKRASTSSAAKWHRFVNAVNDD